MKAWFDIYCNAVSRYRAMGKPDAQNDRGEQLELALIEDTPVSPSASRKQRELDVIAVIHEKPGITTQDICIHLSSEHGDRRISDALTRLRRRCVVEWRHGRGKGWYATGIPVEQEILVDADTPWEQDIACRIAVEECPNGMHMQTIAELTGLSRQRVEQIIRKGLEKVRYEILRERMREEAKASKLREQRARDLHRKVDMGSVADVNWLDE